MKEEPVFLYFSDDSSASFRCLVDGKVSMVYANMDISSCDSSQGPSVFESLLEMCPHVARPHMEALLRQCQSEAVCGHGYRKIRVKPIGYFEYSGSVLTTTLNNIANLNIGVSLYDRLPLLPLDELKVEIERRLSNCGWKCTIEWCENIHQVQFLKCSPCLTIHGEVVPFLNFGVILRSLGQKSWDLPGQGELQSRAYAFNAGLVSGFQHAGETELLSLLRYKFPLKGVTPLYNSNIVEYMSHGIKTPILDCTCLCRYGLSRGHYDELLALLAGADHGDLIRCEASDVIMKVDYGL